MTGIQYTAPAGYITLHRWPPAPRQPPVVPAAVEYRTPPRPPRIAWKVRGVLLPFCGHTVQHGAGRDRYGAETVFDGGPYLELRCEHSSIIGTARVVESQPLMVADGDVWWRRHEQLRAAGCRALDPRLPHRRRRVAVVDRARLDREPRPPPGERPLLRHAEGHLEPRSPRSRSSRCARATARSDAGERHAGRRDHPGAIPQTDRTAAVSRSPDRRGRPAHRREHDEQAPDAGVAARRSR